MPKWMDDLKQAQARQKQANEAEAKLLGKKDEKKKKKDKPRK